MRVFYAMTLPSPIKDYCLDLIHSLKTQHQFKYCRWTNPENLHITLRFNGQIDEETLSKINAQLTENLTHCESVTLSTRRIILFPNKKPHLIAVAIHLNEELAHLVRVVNEAHSAAGIPLEKRPFVAHITLGRFRETMMPENFSLHSVKTVDGIGDEIVLYKSEPTESGSQYTLLTRFQLKKNY
jgi:2'-5' RNA ligase